MPLVHCAGPDLCSEGFQYASARFALNSTATKLATVQFEFSYLSSPEQVRTCCHVAQRIESQHQKRLFMPKIQNSPMLGAARTALVMAGVLIFIFSVTRLGLMLYSGVQAVPLSMWPAVMAKGLLFDLLVTAVLIAPVLAYEALLPNRWRGHKLHRSARWVFIILAISLLLFGAVAEATFWIEFYTRFNFIAVDYLLYTQEVIGNIRQSYPVPLILLGIALLAAAISFSLRGMLNKTAPAPLLLAHRAGLVAIAIALPLASYSLANVDNMQGFNNSYADELSGNGLMTLTAAMRRNELDYDKFYLTMPQAQANTILKGLGVEREPLTEALKPDPPEDRADDVTPFSRPPKNVVLISVESLSASFSGAYGAANSFTPQLDAIASLGLKFDQVFATGTRTVRGLEALSLGTPPVPGQAIVRRPNNEHLATLGEILKPQGIQPYFFYGGYGYFDNMNAYFDANSYQVVDRTSIPKESVMFENVWGVADEVLFNHAIITLNQNQAQNKPFFAQIMTTTNHRPFTYPDGRISIPSPGGREGAVRYTDYAIGKFLKDAAAQPWFKDTLFVIVADHCASVAGKSKLPVENYRIPLVFYAPDMLKPAVFPHLVSQIDLAPTLVEVLGKSGDDHFFGRSVFEAPPHLSRAFISNYQELGYLRNNTLTVLSPRQKVSSFVIDPVTLQATPAEPNQTFVNEAVAYYQTASRAFKMGALRISQVPAARKR